MRGGRRVAAAVIAALVTAMSPAIFAQDSGGSPRVAASHFQRAIALYSEADYRAALVEFKRAYAIAPNAAVLYNIGQTQFELQDYAAALTTFERYLAETNASDRHRREVEASVKQLANRVGYLIVSSVPDGADIEVGDQIVGKTPLGKPVRVSVGACKVVATMAGRLPVAQVVEVASGDEARVQLTLPLLAEPVPTAPWPWVPERERKEEEPSPPVPASSSGATLEALGWVATGVLTVGAATFGALAAHQADLLHSAREQVPSPSAVVTQDQRLTNAYSILAESLGGAAIVAGGITLFATLASSHAPPPAGAVSIPHFALGLGSARFETAF